MLSQADIEALIHLRLPEDEVKRQLLNLTPDQVDDALFNRLIETMIEQRVPMPTLAVPVLDCCGTGGSGLPHFNTSTTVAFILAAGGVPVVKFGNRAASSLSGSFDFLEKLGIPPEISLERIPEFIEDCGLVFLYAPQCYPALAGFQQLRRSLGVPTVFNYLGPLLNPMKPAYRVLGVSHAAMQRRLAQHLSNEPTNRQAVIITGDDGLDELPCQGGATVLRVADGRVRETRFEAEKNGYRHPSPDLPLTPQHNFEIFTRLLTGEDRNSRFHRMVCLNAGAGFEITGHVGSLEEGAALAAELLSGGKVAETLNKFRRCHARHSG